jgi:hypothetical protein
MGELRNLIISNYHQARFDYKEMPPRSIGTKCSLGARGVADWRGAACDADSLG